MSKLDEIRKYTKLVEIYDAIDDGEDVLRTECGTLHGEIADDIREIIKSEIVQTINDGAENEN